MSRLEGEKLIRLIIADVVRECAVRGHGVSDSLAAFMVKAVVLDPRNGFNVDRTLTKQDVQKLEELCLDKLLKKCSPSLDTIKMQVYFNMTYTSRRGFLEEAERAGRSTLSALRRGITESRVNSREQLQAAYRDMVRYTLLQSGLGSASDPRAVQEATAALQSIFPQSKLGVFMVLSRREKEQQLDELSRTVTGIRLFNQASVKGEQQLHAHQLSTQTSCAGSVRADETQRLSWRYTAALERLTGPDSGPGPCEAPLGLLKQALYNLRQHQHFLNILQADTQACVQHAAVLEAELSSLVEQLKQAVRSRTAVPTTLVSVSGFPQACRRRLCDSFLKLCLFLVPSPASFLPLSLSPVQVCSHESLVSPRVPDERVDPAEMKMRDEDEWLWPEAADFSRLPLQYSGFCGFTLVDRDGLLLPGNPNIGVLKHKEKLYVFSSKRAAVQFSSDPDAFASEVAERAKRSPELIQLLQLHQDLSAAAPPAQVRLTPPGQRFLEKSITKRDSGAQTELHPVVTNIDASYEWNEWELRRKALRLADLRTKVTHSTQTGRSHMRRENASQTWLPKDAACQTKRDGQSGVPTPQVYLAGLRGQRHGQLVKTDLTRPVSPQ
uniref:Cilia- and flagella-associated protein 206 n=1 Tax=Salarias fasciatus TaxID=181472 RepID=A0A672GU92_SALFA